jgi:uncharacterized protein
VSDVGPKPGERDLGTLLCSMRPVLHEPVHVFATLAFGREPPATRRPILRFSEPEGLTVVVEREAAVAAGLSGVFPCRMVTLEARSALDADGFLAAVTSELARGGIGVNPVAAYDHDHLFVPHDRAEDASRALLDLAAAHRTREAAAT